MISKRQFEILNRLYTHRNTQINLEQLADFLDVSSRTIRSDLESIQEELKDESMSVSIIRNKAILQIYDSQKAEQYMDQLSSKTQKMIHFVDENQRAKYIIEKMLLSNKDYINMDDIADELFISRSRLSNDLKIVQSILQKYDLQLDKLRGVGIRVLGDTLNKRNCLIKESTVVVAENIKKIRNEKYNHMIDNAEEVVTDVLVNNNYILSDIALQNLIVHVAATVEMLLRNHLIDYEKEEIAYGAYLHEYEIAKKIFSQFQKKFYFPYNEREIQLLAISIHGKREYDNNDYIANELNNKVYKGLKKVKERFHMDFSVNINLRISLALHLEPLITRLKTHSQLENVLIYDVKKSYPL
ncbi:MAG: BglG family transcription antiterminator, partial [Floccifex sp.]